MDHCSLRVSERRAWRYLVHRRIGDPWGGSDACATVWLSGGDGRGWGQLPVLRLERSVSRGVRFRGGIFSLRVEAFHPYTAVHSLVELACGFHGLGLPCLRLGRGESFEVSSRCWQYGRSLWRVPRELLSVFLGSCASFLRLESGGWFHRLMYPVHVSDRTPVRREIEERIDNFASGLEEEVLTPPNADGMKLLALYSRNRPEWVIAEQAAFSHSAITVPLYDTLGPENLEYIVDQTGVTTVVCGGPSELKKLADLVSEGKCPTLKVSVSCGGRGGGSLRCRFILSRRLSL